MRVVSLVPSWTETLIECGVNVVGRTRFCIHPKNEIAIVGGTKDLNREELAQLKPDLVILDQEENLPGMAENLPIHLTHVEKTDDVPEELERLAARLNNQKLGELANAWRERLAHPAYPQKKIAELPGVLEWIKKPNREPEHILYLIWRGPWMAVSAQTFIGSMLTQVGFGGRLPHFPEKYPKIDLQNFDRETTLLLLSSEPYPFGKKKQEIRSLDFPSALVDGEAYSWFGLRSLRFLESITPHNN
jgi:hypothetical protein